MARPWGLNRLWLRRPPAGVERLVRFKRWPTLMEKWRGQKVRIWSGEHEAYWRPDGAGYTSDGLKAGVYDFDDAWNRTNHCGPEKRIEYRLT